MKPFFPYIGSKWTLAPRYGVTTNGIESVFVVMKRRRRAKKIAKNSQQGGV